jgi:hypothetical protein
MWALWPGVFWFSLFANLKNSSIGAAGQKIARLSEVEPRPNRGRSILGCLKSFLQLMETRDTLTIFRTAG